MSRDIESGVTTEIAKEAVQPILFVDMDFDTTPLRLWSGIGSLSWDSKTWLGAGDQGTISTITETEDLRAESVTLSFNGIPSEMISLAMPVDPDDNYQNRTCTIYLGFILNNSVVADPVQIFQGRMDVMTIDEGGETSAVSMTVQSRIADLLKTREWRYTHEDQQIDYPGDLGLEFVVDLQDKELVWSPS